MTSTFGPRGPGSRGPSGDPLVGRVLDGRYEITERLARGGMATVYRGIDTRLTRTVAVKIMHVGLGDDVEFARKFDREARAAARLSHPNVVSVFDQGADAVDGNVVRPYIVMEYVEGQTLRDVVNAHAPLDPLAGPRPARARRRRARRRPRRRARAPRRQARERPARRPRPGQGRRLRPGQGDQLADPDRDPGPADRHRLLPAARAGDLRSRRRPQRRLQRRRRALRAAHRAQAAQRRHPDPGRVRPRPQRRPAALDARPVRRRSRRTSTPSSPGPPPATPRCARPTDACCSPRCAGSARPCATGCADDPELTQDLTPRARRRDAGPGAPPATEVVGDRADFEATQHIASASARRSFAAPGEEPRTRTRSDPRHTRHADRVRPARRTRRCGTRRRRPSRATTPGSAAPADRALRADRHAPRARGPPPPPRLARAHPRAAAHHPRRGDRLVPRPRAASPAPRRSPP